MIKLVLLSLFIILSSCTSTNPSRGIASLESESPQSLANKISPFTTDGCPQFPYGINYPNQNKWALCCVQHDVAYWKGGTSEERQEADKLLRDCIITQNESNTAGLVYLGVRHLDTEAYVMTRRWGYGWKVNRGYTPLSEDDKKQISPLEKEIPNHYDTISLMPRPKSFMQASDTLTGNFCIDGVLSFIGHQLHRTLSPMRFEHSITKEGQGFIETVKINDLLFPDPYEFKFYISKKSACTTPPNRRDKETVIELRSFSY